MTDPMQGIKYGLAFLFGVVYSSCWWVVLLALGKGEMGKSPWFVIPILAVIFGSIFIVMGTIVFLVDHW